MWLGVVPVARGPYNYYSSVTGRIARRIHFFFYKWKLRL